MASTNFVVKNGLTVASGTVVAGGSSGTNGQVLASTGTGVQWVNASSGSGDVVGPASSTDNAVTRFDSTTGKLIQNSTVTLDDNGNFDNVNSVVLDNTPATLPTGAGTIYWEDGEGTPEVILKGGNTLVKVGTQEYARVYNDSGSTVTKGQVVYISGAQGNRIAVKLARADVEATSYGTLGFVAETITNGAEGWVIVSGALYKLNTLGLTAGATVYLSTTTAGAYTTTKPQAPDQLVVLGFIERVSSTVGSIYVKVDNGYELDELHDVRITSPISGNTLIYDATTSPTGVWKNASLTAGTGISVTNGAGSITIGNTGVTSVSGTSPVVSSGTATPAISLASGYGDTQNPYGSKTANYFLAAPNGTAGVPTFRAIVAADIPTLNQSTTGTAANITATSNTTLTTLSSLVSIGTITTGTWNASAIGVAYGGTGSTTLTSGSYVVGNGTSAVTLKTPTQVTADLDTFTYQIGGTAGKKGLVPAAPAIGASVVYLDQTGSWTTPSGSGTTTNALTISSPLTGTSFNGSSAVTIGIPAATSTVNGYLTSTDWTTFNNKGNGTVTSVAAGTYLTGGTITTSGTLNVDATSANTASKVVARDASGNFSAGTITATLNGNASTVGGLNPNQFYNNMGQNHGTYTDFNSVPNFGNYYVQQGTNGPTGVGANQFYGFTLGLGNEYALSQYASQIYYPRRAQNSDTYIYVRDKEGGSWTSWVKIKAGYADTSGTATSAATLTTARTINATSFNGSADITIGSKSNIGTPSAQGTNYYGTIYVSQTATPTGGSTGDLYLVY